MKALSARRVPTARAVGEDESDSYMLAFGDEEHPAWMRVWPEGGGVAVESDWGHLRVEGITQVSTRRGRLVLVSPQEGERLELELSPNGAWRADRAVGLPETDVHAEPHAGGGEGPDTRSSREAAERVTLRGRIGAAVLFRETPGRHQLVATFPLGVHPDEETTRWYTVVAFGRWARRLREKGLEVGQEVEVVGYPHARGRRGRTGDTRTETQIYAAAVRTTLKDPPPGRSSA